MFNEIIDRSGTSCEKFDSLERIFGTDDVIPLWVADMDFASADVIVEVLKRRVEHRVFGYTYRSQAYNDAIKGWVARRAGWQIKDEWLAFSPGVVVGVTFAMLSCTSEGDGILIQQPVYHPFAMVIKANNRQVINNELLNTEQGYRIDFEDFEEKLKHSKAFILCNPHNPTGRCFSQAELKRMGDLCVKYGVRIISDEIHSDFVYKPYKHIHIASISREIADNTITFIAPSKSFNLAGLSTAVAISSSEKILKEYNQELHKIHLDSGNIFGIEALMAAYNDGDEWMDSMKEYLCGNIDYVIDFLRKNLPEVKCHRPEATYLMWLDFSAWRMTQAELNEFIVKKAGLGTTSGVIFGDGGRGFQRMNVGSPRAVIEKAMNQLERARNEKANQ
ncbi:Aspartate aminotransferase [Mucinivorans hirudinis]|uniref:cysteine-S-conjugate beta-lyase n=1 Tax=Mucinivorans hirudinis TaxID=1433126 RepID=A0A060RDD4_9BACT|nr:Aspartate aminotransferase [Mucinivorans hirudinis]